MATRSSLPSDGAYVTDGPAVPTAGEVRRSRLTRWVPGYTPSVLVTLLTLLNAADLLTTRAVLARGGVEGNPLMRPLVEGMWGAVLLKGACLLVVAVLVRRCPQSPRMLRVLTAVVVWYGVVVTWNVVTMARIA